MQKSEKINLLNDIMFKSIIRSMEARQLVSKALSAITGISVDVLINADYQGGELPNKKLKEKLKVSDVVVKVDDGNRIILEMNQYYTNEIINKNASYAFSAISENIIRNRKEFSKYKYNYPNVILISFDNYDAFNTDKGVLCFKIRDESGNIETNIYTSYHIILDKKVNREYNNSEIKELVDFLKSDNLEELKNKYEGNEEIMACVRRVEELREDPDFVRYYDYEESHKQDLEASYDTGLEQGVKQGIEKGIVQGSKREKIEIARAMLNEKLDIQLISKTTGLSTEEIEELARK